MAHNTSLKCRLGARPCLLIEFCNFCSSPESAHPFRQFKHVKLCLSPSNYLQNRETAPAAPWPWEELRGKSPENNLLLAKKGHWDKSQVWFKIEIELRIRLRMRIENIPVADCSPCGNLYSCFQPKSPQKSLVLITPRLLHMTSGKKGVSIFFLATL